MDTTNPFASPQVDSHFVGDTLPVRPFRDALNTGVRLYSINFQQIFIITAIIWGPLELIQAYCDYFVFDAEDFRSSFRLQQALDSLIGIIATGAVVAIGVASLRGETKSTFGALDAGFSAWPRMFWTRLVLGFVLLFAFLALIIPGIYVTFRLLLVEPVLIAEHTSGIDCLKRAWQLAEKRIWLLAGLIVSTYIPLMAVSILLFFPLGFFPELDHWLLSAALSTLVDLLMQIPTLVLVAVYFQAIRQQGSTSSSPSP